jgi:hypothetical protein
MIIVGMSKNFSLSLFSYIVEIKTEINRERVREREILIHKLSQLLESSETQKLKKSSIKTPEIPLIQFKEHLIFHLKNISQTIYFQA